MYSPLRDLLFSSWLFIFFFNDPPTTEIYTLSLHDALPILAHRSSAAGSPVPGPPTKRVLVRGSSANRTVPNWRSEEHTSELQSQSNLVCRLLLEKKNKSET